MDTILKFEQIIQDLDSSFTKNLLLGNGFSIGALIVIGAGVNLLI
jgi:hypothetical protein